MYLSLQNLQSSINVADGLGTTELMIVYVSVTSAFLPTLLISKLGIKWSRVISMFGYLAYISAAVRATWVSIISTSVLLGVGTACLWTAEMAFITELARRYSSITDSKYSDNLDRFSAYFLQYINQGPVVQSVVSLTSSLRVISLTVLADSIHNILIFFVEKM